MREACKPFQYNEQNYVIWIVLIIVLVFLSLKHFHDGRRAQQHIENSWKQLESVSL